LICSDADSHRFFILHHLIAKPLHRTPYTWKEHAMLDVILLALGLVLFALSIGYAYACDRL